MSSATAPNIVIRGIREQDIDLLLLEELVASTQFRIWFFMQVGIAPDAALLKAERSVSTASGESDLELTVREGCRTVMMLVENKVDAPLQPEQAARYRERAGSYCKSGTCDRVVTVVVAPEVYFEPSAKHGFDVFVQYEKVLNWFEAATDLGARAVYKATAMRQAIDRGKRGWRMVPDQITTQFWQSYWELARKVAPDLRMERPDAKPASSCFIPFCPHGLPDGVTLYHKVPYGRVDLQLAGMGEKLAVIQKRYGPFLSSDMRVEKAAKSAAIRIEVDDIEMTKPFAESRQTVEEALAAAMALLTMSRAANEGVRYG